MSRLKDWASEEKAKIAGINGVKKKVEYIWEYYKLWIIGLAFFVWFTGFAIHQYTTTLHDYWCYMIFNNTYADIGTDSEFYQGFVDYAGFDMTEKEMEFNANSYFDYLKGVTGNVYFETFVTYADSGVLDGITMSEESLIALGKSGRLLDLNSEEAASIKAKYGDLFVYSEPFNEEYKEEVPVGIDITDSILSKKYKAYVGDCALGIGANSEHIEEIELFLDYIFKK